jgi:hypothetical protein
VTADARSVLKRHCLKRAPACVEYRMPECSKEQMEGGKVAN